LKQVAVIFLLVLIIDPAQWYNCTRLETFILPEDNRNSILTVFIHKLIFIGDDSMENFVFHNPTKIIFGKGSEIHVGDEIRQYKKVLLHYGQGSVKRSGVFDRVKKSLQEANIEFVELPGVQPNPVLSMVYEGIRVCRENNVDFILALGGGSVIDSAKAIATGVCYNGDVWDFFTQKAQPSAALPTGVILTIAAAGSESSNGTVITNEEGLLKRPFSHSQLYPKFAILNPELTYTLPAYQKACGIADITAHILERYITTAQQVDLSDRLCEACLKTIIAYGPRAISDPSDYEAHAEVMWAGTLAHNGLLGMGRISDWGSHNIEHEISGIYDVPHGAGLAVVFPAWMKYVYTVDLHRFVQFAVRVWGVDYAPGEPERIALAGIDRLTDFFRSLGLPVTLRELNVPDDRLEEMAEKATRNGALGNFKKLYATDVLKILKLAK
jgi:alcohol dehydrogenase YqhD (iron-dependent ADH family)